MPSLSIKTISPVSFVVDSSSDTDSHGDDSSSCSSSSSSSSSSSDFFCSCSLGVRRQANGQPTAATLDRVSEHYAVMRRQETKIYHAADYLNYSPPRSGPATSSQNQKGSSPIDAACREKMVAWCYQVTDYCGFSRSTVEVAMSLVDRFLSKSHSSPHHSSLADKCLTSRRTYQLAVMTALYTSIKVIEPAVFDPAIIASLGRGSVTETQVAEMERRLLGGVDWNVNHPTAAALVYSLADLLPASTTTPSAEHYGRIKATLLTVALYQTELAVSDCGLVTVPSSTVAVAALVHAIRVLEGRGLLHSDAVASFLGHVQVVTGLDVAFSLAVDKVLGRLGELVDGEVIKTALASLESTCSTTTDCSSSSSSATYSTASLSSSSTQQEQTDEVMADAEVKVVGSNNTNYKTSETIACDYVLELNDMSTSTSSGRFSRRPTRRGSTDSLDSLASADSAGTAWSLSPTCIIRGAARQEARYARPLPN